MNLRRKITFLTFALALAIFTTACPNRETISKINADPGRYRNKEVAVAGTVTDSYGVLGKGGYEIDDGTGKLLVVTERGIPSRGSRIGAKGRIANGFSFGGKNFGTVMIESDRRAK
ncbi:MAG: hypothetical protein ABR577_10120 [Pyrinomonadaceae bacterium]